jgi:hypothetical protein
MSNQTVREISGNSNKKTLQAATNVDDLRSSEELPGGQSPIACPPQIANYGFDTIHLSLDLRGFSDLFFESVQSKKLFLQEQDQQEAVFSFLDNGSNLFRWNLQRTGIKFYPYVFRTGDLSLFLSKRKPGSKIPNASLHIGSLSSNQDALRLFKDFKFWLSCISIDCLSDMVSRVDICADITLDIRSQRLEKITRYVCRARDAQAYYSNRKFNQVRFGSGSIMCRIYDKQLEMQQKGEHEKQVFFNMLWKTKKEDPVTRVEFQLRREAIKQFFPHFSSLSDLSLRISDIWHYMTTEWLRHCGTYVDRENNHTHRAANSVFWDIVQNAGSFDRKEKINRKREQKHINIPNLRKQMAGIMTTILAAVGHEWGEFFGVISTATKIISEDLLPLVEDLNYKKVYESKQLRACVSF